MKRNFIAGKKALLFGLSGAGGGFLGNLITEKFLEFDYYHRESFFVSVLHTAIWFGIVGAGIATGILIGYNYYLKRRWQFAQLITQGVLLGLIAGVISGGLAEAIYSGIGPDNLLLNELLRVTCWGIAGSLLGLGLSFRLPNLGRIRGMFGGLVGGGLGGILFIIFAYTLSGTIGRLTGCAAIGFFIGLMLIIAETLFSKAWLLITYDNGETRTINFGKEPLTIGSDDNRSIIYVLNVAPVALRFTLEQGQIISEDVPTGTKNYLKPGYQKRVGNCTITIGGTEEINLISPDPLPSSPIQELAPTVLHQEQSQKQVATLTHFTSQEAIALINFPFTIGREPSNNLVPEEPKCSRYHAQITRENNGSFRYQIIDLNSSNGTFVDEVRLIPHQPLWLNDGDIIRIGEQKWTFSSNSVV